MQLLAEGVKVGKFSNFLTIFLSQHVVQTQPTFCQRKCQEMWEKHYFLACYSRLFSTYLPPCIGDGTDCMRMSFYCLCTVPGFLRPGGMCLLGVNISPIQKVQTPLLQAMPAMLSLSHKRPPWDQASRIQDFGILVGGGVLEQPLAPFQTGKMNEKQPPLKELVWPPAMCSAESSAIGPINRRDLLVRLKLASAKYLHPTDVWCWIDSKKPQASWPWNQQLFLPPMADTQRA